jgi:hypothetical protein
MGHSPVFMLSACLLALAGCTTTSSVRADYEQESNVLEQPLRDVGATRTQAPDALIRAVQAPYALPEPLACDAILSEVAALDAVLGPDLDVIVAARGSIESSATAMMSAAFGGLINIPYRGVVRWLSGAERRDREIRKAILAGMVRRAYLKGVAHSLACSPDAEVANPQPQGEGTSPPPEPEASGMPP